MNDSKQATATIVEFLTARLDEEDSLAWQAALASGWDGYGDSRMRSGQLWVASYHIVKRKRAEGEPIQSRKGRELADCGNMNFERAKHIAHHDPAHILADIAAKRRMVERAWLSVQYLPPEMRTPAKDAAAYDAFWVLDELASVYSDHPDYNPEWQRGSEWGGGR